MEEKRSHCFKCDRDCYYFGGTELPICEGRRWYDE